MAETIVVKNTQAPGDYIVLSAALRDIQRCYPGRYNLIVNVPQRQIFENNPYVLIGGKRDKAREVQAGYNDKRAEFGIHKSNQKRAHFMWGFLANLNLVLGTRAYLTEFKPDLHLTEEEKKTPLINVDRPYWVFVSGGKKDFTAKWWDKLWWQQLVNMLNDKVTMVQVGGGSHIHPTMNGVHDLVKKTSFRDLMRLIYHSQGVICITTCLMHIAAAFNKPCVTIAGGREPWWWESYDAENRLVNMRIGQPTWNPPINDSFIPHRFIHTMDQLPCCMGKGCWMARVGPTGKRCTDQVIQNGVYLPRCMQLIPPERVYENWKWYFDNGICSIKGKTVTVPDMHRVAQLPIPSLLEPVEIPGKAVKVNIPTFVAVYMTESCVNPNEYLGNIKRQVDGAGAEMMVFYDGFNNGLSAFCSGKNIPVHMAQAKPGRAELLRRMIYLAHRDVLIWIEDSVTPKQENWISHLVTPLKDFADKASGTVRWKKITQTQVELIKSAPWFGNRELQVFPFDLKIVKVYYFEPGLFAVRTAALRQLRWPDNRLPNGDLDVLFGEALRQQGIQLHNIDPVITYK